MDVLVAFLAVVVPTGATLFVAMRSTLTRRARELYELANIAHVGEEEAAELRKRARELTLTHTGAASSPLFHVLRMVSIVVLLLGAMVLFLQALGHYREIQRYQALEMAVVEQAVADATGSGEPIDVATEQAKAALEALTNIIRVEQSWLAVWQDVATGVGLLVVGLTMWAMLPYIFQWLVGRKQAKKQPAAIRQQAKEPTAAAVGQQAQESAAESGE